MNLTRSFRVGRQCGLTQLAHCARRHVGSHGNIAVAAQQHQRDCGGVVATVNAEMGRGRFDQVRGTVDVARCFLHAHDARHLGAAQDRLIGHIRNRATRHVIQDHRQIDGLGDFGEMAVDAFLSRLVVIRHNLQRGIRANLPGLLRQLDRLSRGIAARTGNHRNAPRRVFDSGFDHQHMLFNRQRGRFTARTHNDERVRALFDMPVDQLAERRKVEATVFEHRGNDGGHAAANLGAVDVNAVSHETP